MQMPDDEKGHKQLGRAHAAGHLAQLALLLVLGVLAMAQPWPSVGQWRAVFGAYGVIYALEASSSAPLACCGDCCASSAVPKKQVRC
jgi:ethanolaminephosphotransferase